MKNLRPLFTLKCTFVPVVVFLLPLLFQAATADPFTTWHARGTPTTPSLLGVAASPDQFVAFAFNTNVVFRSRDGAHWTMKELPEGQRASYVCFINGRFLAWNLDSKGLVLLESATGSDWKAIGPQNVTNFMAQTFAYEDGLYLAGGGGKFRIWWSRNLRDWTPAAGLPGGGVHGLVRANGRWVGVMDGGKVITSPDARTWQVTSVSQTNRANLWGVTCGNGELVAVTDSGNIWRSGDGEKWEAAAHPAASGFFGIAFGAGWFVACGKGGVIQTSADARNWRKCESGTQSTLRRVAFGQGTFVIVGEHGTILQSDPVP